jgi:hypothetical protein
MEKRLKTRLLMHLWKTGCVIDAVLGKLPATTELPESVYSQASAAATYLP